MTAFVFLNRYFHPDESATSQMLTDLARALATRGFEVHVVCSRQLYDDAGARLAPRERVLGVEVHRIPTTRFGRFRLLGRALDYASFYVSAAVYLLRILRRGDVVIAMTDPPLLSLLTVPIAAVKRATLINWQQDVFPEVASHLGVNPLPAAVDRWLRRLRDASLRSATSNVIIGERMREYFVTRGIPEAKLEVIENWSDADAIQPKPAAASSLRQALGLGDRFVVGYSGNLGRAHEIDTLLGAAEGLKDEPAFLFLMLGGGAKMAALKQAVDARKLKNFRFLEYQPRAALEDSLAAADVHLVSLLPALEGLIVPSKLYGILAAGRPVIFIGDAAGEVGRVILDAQCGRTVAVGDSRGLAETLRLLQAQPDLRAEMGTRARRLLCERFTAQRAFECWTAVLERARR
jgi:glycosyltransferase involved in cell wall biosynthesis